MLGGAIVSAGAMVNGFLVVVVVVEVVDVVEEREVEVTVEVSLVGLDVGEIIVGEGTEDPEDVMGVVGTLVLEVVVELDVESALQIPKSSIT